MSEITQTGFGAALRRRREELKLTLDDVAASTRVRKTYLQALEEENLQALPGKAYAIGFLRIYARQLGLPVANLLHSFSGSEVDVDEEPLPATGASRSRLSRKSKRKGRNSRLSIILVLILLVVGALAYRQWQGQETSPPQEVPSPAAPAMQAPPAQPLPQPSPVVASQPGVPVSSQEEPKVVFTDLPVLPSGGAVVRMLPVAAGIMKVSLDNQEQREYQLQPDQSLNWKVAGSLACELTTPGLVRVWVDQQEITVAEYPAFTLKLGPPQEQRP